MKRILKSASLVGMLLALFLMILPTAGASAATGGGCNDETATALGEQYDLNPFAPVTTDMSALCGEFLGPGIEAMVARAVPATCGGYAGWAVFRHEADGSWQLVWKERDGQWNLTAVGNDLEETDNILGPNDARCVGEKTTKTRIWHWDGQQFVAGPWTIHPLGLTSAFKTGGSHPFICIMVDDPKIVAIPGSISHLGVSCMNGRYISKKRSYSQKAELKPNGRVKVCKKYYPGNCYGSFCGCSEDFPELHSGEQVVVGRYSCRILKSSVECTNTIGQGFVINSKKIRRLS